MRMSNNLLLIRSSRLLINKELLQRIIFPKITILLKVFWVNNSFVFD